MSAWHVLAGVLALWVLTVPAWTLLFFWALMHVDKAEHEGWAAPEAVWIARHVLLPVGALNNLVCAWTWAPFYYRALPFFYPGVTKFTNAMVARGGWRAERALRLRERYLNRWDRRGVHQ